jgi:hypothetical protein
LALLPVAAFVCCPTMAHTQRNENKIASTFLFMFMDERIKKLYDISSVFFDDLFIYFTNGEIY